MRHPGLSILLAGGLLVALKIPALQMNIATTASTSSRRRARDPDLQQGQGSVPERGRHGDRSRGGRRRTLRSAARGIDELRAQVNGSEGFRPGTEVIYSEDGTGRPDQRSDPRQRKRRPVDERPQRAARRHHSGDSRAVEGTTVNVTGDAAGSQDFANKLNAGCR